eukprot:1047277-Prymnesium_polylepis.1
MVHTTLRFHPRAAQLERVVGQRIQSLSTRGWCGASGPCASASRAHAPRDCPCGSAANASRAVRHAQRR